MVEHWQPLFFQDPPGPTWQHHDQYFYSLLWSAFLDLDAYSTSLQRRRFFPYSTHFVVRELLPENDEVRALVDGAEPERRGAAGQRLDLRFRDLALWTVIPRLLGPTPYQEPSAPRRRRFDLDDAATSRRLGAIVCDHLRESCDIDVAAFRLDAGSRPIVPPGLALGIGDAKLEVTAGRRTAKARLSAVVQVPYRRDTVARLTDPRTWRLFTYWDPVESEAAASPGVLPMKLLLPGGNRATRSKWRELSFAHAAAVTPFEARIDYQGVESNDPEVAPSDPRLSAAKRNEVQRAGIVTEEIDGLFEQREPWGRDFPHVREIRGYLSLQKVEARPHWTRLVAEREVRFESPNHDRFRVETLMFWLTCDLVSFALKFSPDAAPARGAAG